MKRGFLANAPKKIRQILEANDFVILRISKHVIFQHVPSGKTVVVSQSKITSRNENNKIADIKRLLKEVGAVYQGPG